MNSLVKEQHKMNKNKLEDFLKRNPPKYPIRKYEEDILYLLHEGSTQEQILKYLEEECEFKCSRQTLSKHIKHLKSTHQNKARAIKKKNENSLNNKARANMDDDEFLEKLNKIGG